MCMAVLFIVLSTLFLIGVCLYPTKSIDGEYSKLILCGFEIELAASIAPMEYGYIEVWNHEIQIDAEKLVCISIT